MNALAIFTTGNATPVRPFLTLSVGHVSQATEAWLNAAAAAAKINWVSITPCGWFVYCDEHPQPEDFPADLIAAFEHARNRGCEYIMFDSEQDPTFELPFYITAEGEWRNVPV